MNDHNVTEESKNAAVKVLAIVGFIALVALGAWLSIQIVRVIPSAFSSLASIADGIQANRPVETLSVATEQSIVNTGESVAVTFTDLERDGTYTFSYACTEGVSLGVRIDNDVTTLDCNEVLTLPSGTFTLDLIPESEKRRFIDVPFTVAFTQTGQDEHMFERNGTITIVNASIPQSVDVAIENGEDTPEDTETEPEPTVDGGSTGVPAAPAPSPAPSQPVEREISFIPTSDPNGFTDLRVIYLGVGTLEGNTFMPAGSIDNDERGALRFEVRNIGTKTSDEWTFDALLPSGMTFTSDEQAGLKPNERATITLGFDVSETGTQDISVEVDAENDTDESNNKFEWSVEVTN